VATRKRGAATVKPTSPGQYVPGSARPPIIPVTDPRRAQLLEAARVRGYPSVPIRPGETLMQGELAWTLCCLYGSTLDVRGAADSLRKVAKPSD
jgi:hypothetical protein